MAEASSGASSGFRLARPFLNHRFVLTTHHRSLACRFVVNVFVSRFKSRCESHTVLRVMVQFGSRCESDTAYISQAFLSRGTQRVHAMRIVIASLFSRASTRHWRRKANPGAIIVDRLNIAQILITASTRVWHNAGEMLLWQMPHVFTGLPTIA